MGWIEEVTSERKFFPESKAIKVWAKDDVVHSIVRNGIDISDGLEELMARMAAKLPSLPDGGKSLLPASLWYCAYARFQRPILRQPGYSGIATWVPVHGGITYARTDEQGVVYGFDCNHATDSTNPRMRNTKWIASEAEGMAAGLKLASKYETMFFAAAGREAKLEAISQFHSEAASNGLAFELADNFGAMIEELFEGGLDK